MPNLKKTYHVDNWVSNHIHTIEIKGDKDYTREEYALQEWDSKVGVT